VATYSLGEFLEDDSIVLEDIPSKKAPKGKAYRFASPDFETGLWLKNLIEFGQRVALGGEVRDSDTERLNLDDDEEVDLYRRVMGDTFEQLRTDGVSWGHVQKVFQLLLKHWGTGQDVAATLREAAGEAEAQPNRTARRASARSSSPTAGSKSSRASTATKARTAAKASTRSSGTSANAKPRRAS
jgi:hypothetical protein